MDCKGNAFFFNISKLICTIFTAKMSDNGLYTKYIKKFRPKYVLFSYGQWNTEILQIIRYCYLIERFLISKVTSIYSRLPSM